MEYIDAMDDSQLFINGTPNPDKFGWSLRTSAGVSPDPNTITEAASILDRPVFFVDDNGYEREIIGAAINGANDLAFVESRAKEIAKDPYGSAVIDVQFQVHLMRHTGAHNFTGLLSYNPYFGCDVRFLEWFGKYAILIYREKHSTYACCLNNDDWPPEFIEIADRWIINNNVLSFMHYNDTIVRRRMLPHLGQLESIDVSEAEQTGQLPPDPWAT